MSAEEEIIIIGGGKGGPGKKPNSAEPAVEVTVAPQGVARFRDVLKQYSTWALALIVAGPDLYQAASSLGLLSDQQVPDALAWSIRGLAGLGLAVKFIRQTRPAA
ncbi:hypothetical protein Psesu_1158 [Pseudoxanthomonas suwonensis 11-1]|uniref:Holin n=1 Tax=Pseudoxanthomonas suwonensis (strain 11-1) TaxID=743721 RepID=E6WS59_PSEUU|nr:hypothetical protein [Pseudoxanthomonas suwonensis]ADV27008.1 hypothetical protein Psesu_1158 [Pseudoxanthomonas suwonensis 11-1]